MYKLKNKPNYTTVSPEEAEMFLKLNDFPGQRTMSEEKARLYADLMRQGSMRRIDIATAIMPDGKVEYLMNGQHVCRAVVLYGKEYPAVLETYACSDMNDAWKLFATYDTHASRTQGQVMRAARELLSVPHLESVSLKVMTVCGSALWYLGDNAGDVNFTRETVSKTIKPEYVGKNPDAVLWVKRYEKHAHMMRVGIVSAMIATFRANEELATAFWDWVGTGDCPTDHPAFMLRDYLKDKRYLSGPTSRDSHRKAYIACVVWWNAFLCGEHKTAAGVGKTQQMPTVLTESRHNGPTGFTRRTR